MPEPETIVDVMRRELVDIRKRRAHLFPTPPQGGEAAEVATDGPDDVDAELMRLRVEMLEAHATGLAISGGGIRSGTFAVGFLQGLANLGLLGRFDYLSTVSGGGYAGAWLAAWLKREGDVANVEKQLDFSRIRQAESSREFFNPGGARRPVVDEEPEPLRHLRSYSSYMFPRPGPMSADTWTVILIWARNVLINLLMLFPLAMLAVLLMRLGVYFFNALNADRVEVSPSGRAWAWGFLILGWCAGQRAFLCHAEALPEFRKGDPSSRPRGPLGKAWFAVVLTLTAAFCLTVASRWFLGNLGRWLAGQGPGPSGGTWLGILWGLVLANLDLLQVPTFLLAMGACALFMGVGEARNGQWTGASSPRFVLAAAMAGATGGFLFVLLLGLIRAFARMNRPDLMATFAIPGALAVAIVAVIVEVAIAGRAMTEAEREWWARYSARLAIHALLWLGVMASALYLPALFLAGGAAARLAIASGWLGTTALGVVTGRFVLPKLQARGGGQTLAMVAAVAPPIFLVGLLGLVGLLASFLLNMPGLGSPHGDDLSAFAYYLEGVRGTRGWVIALLGIGFGYLAWLGFVLIDVNLFSLNAMYAQRLVRCYLGASRRNGDWARRWGGRHDPTANAGSPSISDRQPLPPRRDANPVTGFDPGDDLPLSDLRIGEPTSQGRAYWGPLLLINTTLNLVGGGNLALRDRKGESFTLSPLSCGAKGVGYATVGDDPETRANLTLGRAMAISGAAVDPNMRFYQSPALTALLLIFNARLGSWIQNPLKGDWRAGVPKFGGLLLTELLGETDGRGDYVHLSDGGHFENLGVYELIRRRCRYIVAIDAGEEDRASNANLATLIRLCRVDFGVRILIDTEPLTARGPDKLSRTHVAVGRIRYDDTDQGQLPGVLVYVRVSMTGDEPPDLQCYAGEDPNFPHQATDLRQSFDDEQFECYRCLGDHIARDTFQDAVNRAFTPETLGHEDYVSRLFSATQARWQDAPEAQSEDFVASTESRIALHRDLRDDPALARLSRELYPELPPAPTPAPGASPPIAPDYDRAEVHAVGQMLQIMEKTWLTLGLRRSADLPLNRGWENAFRRWANTPAFQRLWPQLRVEYASDFVRFCQDELHLQAFPSRVISHDGALRLPGGFANRAMAQLSEEYGREWPDAIAPALPRRIAQALATPTVAEGPPLWLVVQDVPTPTGAPPTPFVTGIILVAPFADLSSDFPGYAPPDSAKFLDESARVPLEFFAWMRCGFRSADLGSPCVRKVLDDLLPKALGVGAAGLPTLWARYPKAGEFGDNDVERELWLSFFARSNFRREYPAGTGAWKSTLLRR